MAKDNTTPLIIGAAALGILFLAKGKVGVKGGYDIDLTDDSPKEKRKGTRDWEDITGITLHQVGVSGMNPKAWRKVTAHLGVHTDGTVYLIHPLPAYLWHGHKLNRDTVGIEVAGNFVGDLSKPESYWKAGGGPDSLNSAQITGLRRAIAYIVNEVKRHGGKIENVFAHRQASSGRTVDPGAEIWQAGGIWAQKKYGLTEGGCDYYRGTGKTIPGWWDEKCGPLPGTVQTVAEEEVVFSSEAEGAEFPG